MAGLQGQQDILRESKELAIASSKHQRVRDVAGAADQKELRHALSLIGWQGPVYGAAPLEAQFKKRGKMSNAAQAAFHEEQKHYAALVRRTWTNIVAGLGHWWETNAADFNDRVPKMIEQHRTQIGAHLKYVNNCDWVQCDQCNKWRRCPPEFKNTLQMGEWTCGSAFRECEEEEDEVDESEVWNASING